MSDYIVRLISSSDHDIPKDVLISRIEKFGTDRYDSDRKQIFNDFYQKHRIDFFGTLVGENDLDTKIVQLKEEFLTKTKSDRNTAVTADIAIIYDADQCEMVQNVYESTEASDCFRFKVAANRALKEVRSI